MLPTPFPPCLGDGSDGRDPSPEPYLDLGPDFRFASPGTREAWRTFKSASTEHLVVLKTVVGGLMSKRARRPELGETVVAISPDGQRLFFLLSSGKPVPYTDEAWGRFAAAQ
ncbi:hypothetical protein GobsT_23930 [Gemmata obscuriglobus]|uniref:Uncharacterized protein n=1 Tax=Gemmata obscuriglobus TaxID=114 RepID=A0A2Z3HCA7_9BACT|nr:hypothetical protein [Gemmata obscuriglobus]AWM39304.1 hypothetical protein C1280_21475 [Gemmata obscuriglobus]QEG27634.1 hypothetical protein GobsT_23930 [Gemmata obscuriglobus]VTS04791.1 Uncharacterized protein OS=Singulisphaera acidiphila (strain ATCC BAA-1392 / DSM 18658 / VKM B-2454 / MOB10) GN=Sinac_0433 PE=4 SV=1 [Gemmata obscuriglobus UQM 2246]